MNKTPVDSIEKIIKFTYRYGKSTYGLNMLIANALNGKEGLYATPKGNVVIRSVEKDKELISQQREKDRKMLESVLESMDGIIANDKTPRYSYGTKGKNTINADGKQTGDGSRWSTPREIAEDVKKFLKEGINK